MYYEYSDDKVGPFDDLRLIPAAPIAGGPDGFRIQGILTIRYTAAETYSVQLEVDATNGYTGQYQAFNVGENMTATIPIYATLEWPQQQDHQARINIGATPSGTIHAVRLDVEMTRKGSVIA